MIELETIGFLTDQQREERQQHAAFKIRSALADLPGAPDHKRAAADMLAKSSARDKEGNVVVVRRGAPLSIRDAYASVVTIGGRLYHADEVSQDAALYQKFREENGLNKRR